MQLHNQLMRAAMTYRAVANELVPEQTWDKSEIDKTDALIEALAHHKYYTIDFNQLGKVVHLALGSEVDATTAPL